MVKRLTKLDPAEVSLVKEGANLRKFLVLKMKNPDIAKHVTQVDSGTMKSLEKILKEYQTKDTDHEGPLDDQAQAALKAVVRILTPLKDKLSPMLLHEVLSTAGLQTMQAETADTETGGEGFMQKGATMSPEPIKEEHHIEAMKMAKAAFHKAYKEHVGKLGYQMYPDAKMQQKDLAPGVVNDDTNEEEEQMGHPVGEGKLAGLHEPEVGAMSHESSDDLHKKVTKSLLAKVPKETRPALEMIFKERSELIQKTQRLESALQHEVEIRKSKEFAEKAASFKNLGVPVADLAKTLKEASEKMPAEQYEAIEKMLRTADTQAAGIYKEIGSALPGRGSDAEAKIDAAVNQIVQKDGKLGYAEAYTKFIETTEGQRLYNEYKAQRGGI